MCRLSLVRWIAAVAILAQALAPAASLARGGEAAWLHSAVCAPSGGLPAAVRADVASILNSIAGEEDGGQSTQGGHCPACVAAAPCAPPDPASAPPVRIAYAAWDRSTPSGTAATAPIRGPPLGQRGPPAHLRHSSVI